MGGTCVKSCGAHITWPACRMMHAQNPFGAAKPREAVLANRSGKTESEILQEEVAKEKLKVLLTVDCCI